MADPTAADVAVSLRVPGMLADCLEGRRSVELRLRADTLDAALEAVRGRYPRLAAHVWDDGGAVRPHILVFHNDTAIRWMDRLDVPIRGGDRISILQAVSGG